MALLISIKAAPRMAWDFDEISRPSGTEK